MCASQRASPEKLRDGAPVGDRSNGVPWIRILPFSSALRIASGLNCRSAATLGALAGWGPSAVPWHDAQFTRNASAPSCGAARPAAPRRCPDTEQQRQRQTMNERRIASSHARRSARRSRPPPGHPVALRMTCSTGPSWPRQPRTVANRLATRARRALAEALTKSTQNASRFCRRSAPGCCNAVSLALPLAVRAKQPAAGPSAGLVHPAKLFRYQKSNCALIFAKRASRTEFGLRQVAP